jgi:hypothetical protein
MGAARQRLSARPGTPPAQVKPRRSRIRVVAYILTAIIVLAAILAALVFALNLPGLSKFYRLQASRSGSALHLPRSDQSVPNSAIGLAGTGVRDRFFAPL